MSIEGLQALLEKEAIVGTQSAERLAQAPDVVEEAYLRHVRSYVPLGRASGGEKGTFTVSDFEARLITLVKEGKAPVGYVTAEYGYGKTSTLLYVWDRCRRMNLVAVPPFEFTELSQLVTATHAWIRFELGRARPDLVAQADAIRLRYETRSLDDLAREKSIPVETLRDLFARGHLTLTLASIVYVQFFDEMAALVRQGGFDGLVILPDELQQYLEPRIKSGVPEPLNPLFDIVQGMITRRGSLACGLIFSIPARELAVINEHRGDFVQRLKSQGLGFDLRDVYTADFAARLWERLAEGFGFVVEQAAMVHPTALTAIGEIAARPDLASGPRTVVAILQRIVARYLDGSTSSAGGLRPYTPIDLIDDYLAGAIPYDEMGLIRRVVGQRLAASIVAGNREREQAVRLIAAFPTEGAPRPVLEDFSLTATVDELAQVGQGTLIIFLGSTTNPGVTLLGLEPRSEGPRDWLTTTLRDYGRLYEDGSALTMARVVSAFERLLLDRVFAAPEWRVVTRFDRTFTQDRGLLVEGSFANTAKHYPQRTVFVRILRADEEAGDAHRPVRRQDTVVADLTIDIVLHTHSDLPLEERRAVSGMLDLNDPRYPRMNLNLSHHALHTRRPDLHNALQPVVNPYKVCPLLLLSLNEYLEEKRRANAIPKAEDDLIKNTFQLSLADECVDELWNSDLTGPQGAAGSKLFEGVFLDACRHLFPDYKTLMVNPQWHIALKNDYRRALGALQSDLYRQGELPVEGTKAEIAELLGRANTGLDNFIAAFPTLLRVEQQFQSKGSGAVLFTLHPLEREIVAVLKVSARKINLPVPGLAAEFLPALARKDIDALARERGYRDRETDEVLDIMESRGLIARATSQGDLIALAPRRVPSVNELAEAVALLREQFDTLASVYGDATINHYREQLSKIDERLPHLRRTPDEQAMAKLHANLRAYQQHLDKILADKHADLRKELRGLTMPQGLPKKERDLLEKLVPLELFGRHLEGMRRGLHQAFVQYDQRLLTVAGTMTDVEAEIVDEDEGGEIGVEGLVDATRRMRALAIEIAKVQTAREGLGQTYAAFARAISLLNTVALFERGLMRLGPAEIACRIGLDALVHDINAAFATERQEALRGVNTWESKLTGLQQQAADAEQRERSEFDAWQECYRRVLDSHLDLSRVPAPRPQLFDPLNLQESRDRVIDEVQRAIKGVLNVLLDDCRVVQSTLTSIAHSSDMAVLPDEKRDSIIKDAQKCQSLLHRVKQRAAELVKQATADAPTIFDEPSEAFGSVCERLGEQQRDAHETFDLLHLLEAALAQTRLTGPEQDLLDAIQALSTDNGHSVDLGALLASSGQTMATLMPLVGALYTKRRLYVTLEPNI